MMETYSLSDYTLIGILAAWTLKISLAAFSPTIIDFLQSILIRTWTRLGITGRGRLSGRWHHVWYAEGSENFTNANTCTVTLTQIGHLIGGFYQYSGETYCISGRIDKSGYVTGRWFSNDQLGYGGVWGCRLSLTGKEMHGFYLGNSMRAFYGSVGEWIWWREGSQPAPRELLIQQAAKASADVD